MKEPRLPHNLEAEQALLGCILFQSRSYDKIAETITPDMFYRDAHRTIFEVYRSLITRRISPNLISVTDELYRRDVMDTLDDGPKYLADLMENVMTVRDVTVYADIVRRTAIGRKVIQAAADIAQAGYDQEGDPIERSLEILYGISEYSAHAEFQSTADLMPEYLKELEFLQSNKGRITGVPTGYDDLDNPLCGLQDTDLIILAGRPGSGKTSLGMSIAYNAACRGKRVAVFSLEMGRKQLMRRLMSMESKVDMQRLRSGWIESDQWASVLACAKNLAQLPLYINDTSGNPVVSIRSQLRRLIQTQGKVDLVLVDYLGLIKPEEHKNDNRVHEVGRIVLELKNLAKEFNLPVIVLSQLSRSVESRGNKRPILSDLRDSGDIEATADVVLTIYRDDYYAALENRPSENSNVMELQIAKHRNGPTGTVSLYFKADETMCYPLTV